MQAIQLAKVLTKYSSLGAVFAGLLLSSTSTFADSESITTSPLNLSLPSIYTAPPTDGLHGNLTFARDVHQVQLKDLKTNKSYALGLQRHKVDKSMRVRGWEVRDDLYIGQARVGNEWGVGILKSNGSFSYGVNNKGVGMVYSGENSVYRLNLQEVSLEIDF